MTMVAPPARGAGRQRQAPAQPQAQALVPFIDGTYEYSEPIATYTVTPGASSQDLPVTNIIPGGFLRGVSLIVTSTGGTQGTGVFSADNPWSLFGSLTFESIDGTPMLYPMNGWSYYCAARYTRPWSGDPATDETAFYASGANPAFRLSYYLEARATLGCVPNTDARAQYRFRATVNPLSSANPSGGLYTTLGTATAPTVTVAVALETYAQPPRATYTGAPVQPLPPGLALQRFLSHQIDNVGTGDNTVKEQRTGNLIRSLILVFRDTNGNRVDLTSDPIRWRVDNTQLLVESRNRRDYEMWKFFSQQTSPGVASVGRPTGVYVYPRWQNPGEMLGQAWLETIEATFLQFEVLGAASGGTMECITEDLVPVGGVVPQLQNI